MMNVFKKTLKDELLITVIFSILISVLVYLVIQEFAIARHLDFSRILSNVPKILLPIAERLLVLNVFGGYLHIVASVHWTIFSSFFTCMMFSGLISRETENRTLGLLLAHPVTRLRVALEKYGAGVSYLLVVVVIAMLGFYTGIFHGVLKVPFPAYRLWIVGSNGFAFFLALSGVAFLFSVIFNEYKKAAIASLTFFFVSYLSFFLGSFSPRWEKVKQLTFFRFYDTEKLFMTTTVQWENIFALLFITALLVTAGIILFQRKDVTN